MTEALIFTDISEEQISILEETHDADAIQEKLAEFLGNPSTDALSEAQRDVLLDLFMYNYAFCKESYFDARQTSVFLAIINRILEADFATNTESVASSFGSFKKLLLLHSVERSPHSIAVFSPDQAAAVMDYVMNSYYRHFNLYKYCSDEK